MNYLNSLMQGLGVAVGIIAGIVVSMFVSRAKESKKQEQQVKNLQFELEFNVNKIDEWLEEIENYQNSVNGDALHNYAGYFQLSRALFGTANAMYLSGLLYKKLNHAQIGKLQVIILEFSSSWERIINTQVMEAKQVFQSHRAAGTVGDWISTIKPSVVGGAIFWKSKFKEHRESLEEIVRSLD